MQTISRLYANEASARNAWDELKRNGYADAYIFRPPPRGEDGEVRAGAVDALRDAMAKAYIANSSADIYAKRVSDGASLVSVHAPFSGGKQATAILQQHGPVDSGIDEASEPFFGWDEATPLSNALCWPVLTSVEFPFELVTGIPSLIETREETGRPPQPDNPAPFSSAFGMKLLSDKAAPLSSLLGLPVLTRSGPLFYK